MWRELDAIAPPAKPALQPYGGAVPSARAEALSTRSERLVQRLERERLLTAQEAAFFREITGLRLQNMDHGFMRLMVLHTMPPPFLSAKVASVNRLEQQIDALIELRQKEQIADEQMALALDRVQQEAVTLFVLDSLSRELGMTFQLPVTLADGETMLAELARKVDEARSDGGVGDERLAPVLAEAKALVPAIHALVAELER
ncbi:MAG: hypothetical protein JRI68_28005 [Deltaproteobacteria bacterium]|nr:hypothetical protein [Deltaproteobacteria bacterium]